MSCFVVSIDSGTEKASEAGENEVEDAVARIVAANGKSIGIHACLPHVMEGRKEDFRRGGYNEDQHDSKT